MSRQPLYLFLAAVAWAGFFAVTLWSVVFLAGGIVPRTVDGPARTNAAVAITVDLALLLAVRRTALGDGAPSGQGMAAPPDPGGAGAHVICTRHRHLPRPATGAVATMGRPGVARPRDGQPLSSGRSARPAGSWRSRRRSRSTTSSSPGFAKLGGRRPRGPQDERARGRRTARHRSTPTDDRTAPGLLGNPADGCFARTIRCRRDRVHRHRNQVRGARPTAHVRRRVRRLRRTRPGPAAQTPLSDQTSAISAEADEGNNADGLSMMAGRLGPSARRGDLVKGFGRRLCDAIAGPRHVHHSGVCRRGVDSHCVCPPTGVE